VSSVLCSKISVHEFFYLLVILPSERSLSLISLWMCEAVRIYCREGYSIASVWKIETAEIDFISHELTT